jgi:hypothetical protein
VSITTRDGRQLRQEATYRRMTEADLDAKFLELVTLRAGEAKAQHLAPLLKGLDTAVNLDDVMRELELPAATIAAD